MAQPGTHEARQIHIACRHGADLTEAAIVNPLLEPGGFVRHPTQKDWGLGQIQSVIGDRITVNFEHRGKVLIDASKIALEPVFEP